MDETGLRHRHRDRNGEKAASMAEPSYSRNQARRLDEICSS
jgi:hypothetical protein